MTADAIVQFWQAYLHTLPPDAPHREARYVAEAFGDNPTLADELGALIRQGRKTATCSALWEWEAEDMPLVCERFRLLYPPISAASAQGGAESRSPCRGGVASEPV